MVPLFEARAADCVNTALRAAIDQHPLTAVAHNLDRRRGFVAGRDALAKDLLGRCDLFHVEPDALHRALAVARQAFEHDSFDCVLFPRKDVNRIPSHWLTFGPRHSPLTGGPRLSVNPANSLLNYTNAVAESECRLAACACGLDPGLGVLHTDTANRDSLALDLIETIRPAIEAWILDWLMHEPLRRSDFIETVNGNCRLSSGLCSKLSETATTWGRLVAPWAEWVARSLWAGNKGSNGRQSLATPLTHSAVVRREE